MWNVISHPLRSNIELAKNNYLLIEKFRNSHNLKSKKKALSVVAVMVDGHSNTNQPNLPFLKTVEPAGLETRQGSPDALLTPPLILIHTA